jgi:eukaryotic-like serine/threonine-protein kinase
MAVVHTVDRAYVLGELIGRGGMGQVYAAEDADSSRVAVKLLHRALADDPGMVARLVGEGHAGRQVSHHNVVRVIDQGTTEDGAPFVVMERVDGVPLGQLIRAGGPLSLSRIRTLATQILSGLAAIHHAGLVHGDMKSDNILVDSSEGTDRIKIIDLGLARRPGEAPALLDREMVSGTPEYMAPEMIRGEPVTQACDLYGVAVIL